MPVPRHKGLATTQTLLILAPLNGNKEDEQGANDTPKEGLSRPAFFIPRWTKLLCIMYQVCDARGATDFVLKGVSQWSFLTWAAQRQRPNVYLGYGRQSDGPIMLRLGIIEGFGYGMFQAGATTQTRLTNAIMHGSNFTLCLYIY